MRRLFSTFAPGAPGMGLLLMRLMAGGALVAQGLARSPSGLPPGGFVQEIVSIIAGFLVLAGLWSPIAGSLTAVIGLWKALTSIGDPWANIFLSTMGAVLALVGPGVWSIDARIFGWKRIAVRSQKS